MTAVTRRMESRLGDKIVKREWTWLAGFIEGRFGLPVSVDRLREVCARAYVGGSIDDWTDSSWILWIKNRLAELNYFKHGSQKPLCESVATATLHVFFISIHETEDQLALLRLEPNAKTGPTVATPKIERTAVKVKPIDSTAAKVYVGDE